MLRMFKKTPSTTANPPSPASKNVEAPSDSGKSVEGREGPVDQDPAASCDLVGEEYVKGSNGISDETADETADIEAEDGEVAEADGREDPENTKASERGPGEAREEAEKAVGEPLTEGNPSPLEKAAAGRTPSSDSEKSVGDLVNPKPQTLNPKP